MSEIPEDLRAGYDTAVKARDNLVEHIHVDPQGIVMAIERIARAEAKVAALEAEREALDDLQGRLWCALGQPVGVEYVRAVRRLKERNEVLEAENGRLKAALDIISNHGVQYPWPECARIARAALAQQQNPAQDKEQG